jgi:hypothetical protein
MAKRVALPAQSITMVPVQVQGEASSGAVHMIASEQRFGSTWSYLKPCTTSRVKPQTPTKSWL